MRTFVLLIQQPLDRSVSPKTLAAALCPYLQTLGCVEAQLLSLREYDEYRDGAAIGHTAMAEFSISIPPIGELASILSKLGHFVKRLGKDSDSAATFRLFVLEGGANA